MDFPSVEWWPGGALGTFLLFMLPIGPAKPAGISFGIAAELGAPTILSLYLAKEIATACYLEPLLRVVVRIGPRYAWARSLGVQIRALAERTHFGSSWLSQIFSLALVSFGAGFMTGAAALPSARVARPLGWIGVIAGDVCWFSLMLSAAIVLTNVLPDQRLAFVGVALLWLLARPLTKRLTPPAPQTAPID